MVTDQLSEVFDLVEVRGLMSGGFAVRGPWGARTNLSEPLKFIAMVCGGARLTTDGIDGPIELEPGDVAILNNRSWLELEGGTGDGPRQRDSAGARLPVPAPRRRRQRGRRRRHGRPHRSQPGRPGTAAAGTSTGGPCPRLGRDEQPPGESPPIVRRGDLEQIGLRRSRSGSTVSSLLLEVLRACIDQAELPPGWLRVLTDERLRPALRLMHAEPGKSWGLEELARSAAMSRTSFAERFRTVAGVPPLTYLNRWRMLLAQRALRDGDVRVGSLAFDLGYASESAFSTAFKREVGESPLRYRHRVRGELSADSEAPVEAASGL